jgi:hypothetical protein
MKKNLLLSFLLSCHFAYAGTGGAKDETLFLLSIIAVMLIILSVLYSIDFTKRIIKEHKEKKIAHLTDEAYGENIE